MRETSIRRGILAPVLLAVALSAGPAAIFSSKLVEACSRILWKTSLGTYVGRGEDWFEDAPVNLWVLPRGQARDGAAGENSYKWSSRYGSLVITMYDHTSMSGINERGLSSHMLYLNDTSVAPRDPKAPGLSISLWLQWYLDSFATVSEAVAATRNLPFQLRMAMDERGVKGLVHITLEDPSGDSALIEIIKGEVKIYHDRRYIVVTNQPTYDKQLQIIGQYAGFGGDKPLPGTTDASDRFVRGAYYAKHLPEPKDERDALAALMSVMRNVAMPYGMATPERKVGYGDASPTVSFTIFRILLNLDKRVLYFDRIMSPTVFWVRLEGLDFSEGAPVKKLVTAGNDLAFDATDKFQPAKMFVSIPATETTLGGP